ncbi:nucleoside-diphosphate sugar epimerase/dehydratase [Sphingopyxis sp. KK2]|uniref:polysaccharide biosynthesis protein n=1 Tax=Sphingopyxis sp. KK2 TaxID=1855727 RepID=UPI0021177F76|nr:nucleoside-diphosphate sugar epimerase/dehydratase [Sphingopyxis sp. KK2]
MILGRIWGLVEERILAVLATLVALGRSEKRAILIVADALLCVAAVLVAFSLRLGRWEIFDASVGLASVIALSSWLPIFLMRGTYSSILRFSGGRTMVGLAYSVMLYAIPMLVIFGIVGMHGVPRTVAVIQPIIFLLFLAMTRIVARYAVVDLLKRRDIRQQSIALIYGAGEAGQQLAMALRGDPAMRLVGFIDDDRKVEGEIIDGVPIYSRPKLPYLVDTYGVTDVLLALPHVTRSKRRRVMKSLEDWPIRVRMLPNMRQIIDEQVSVSDLRDVQIEDLLGRDPVPPNQLLLGRTIVGKTVMVSGAGGSIGSELCRQIVTMRPDKLILVESSEYGLYAIGQELQAVIAGLPDGQHPELIEELGNVTDQPTVRRLLARWRPDTIFHAAAYKHVPLVEANPIAGIGNNVCGTLFMASEADRIGVANFVLISTDKAVRPTNVMGASKRVCELVLQGLAGRGSQTCFAMVRFGNVLGSSGSVVPLFREQIKQGGPVTVTHRDVTRFFMTIPEAAQLVIQAGAMAKGGEVFVLDMGKPVRIIELARTMINLSGLTVRDEDHPDGDIEISEVGLRQGEKLYEELLIGDDPKPTGHSRIMQAREAMLEWNELSAKLDALRAAMDDGRAGECLEILHDLVPEFRPPEEVNQATASLQAPLAG